MKIKLCGFKEPIALETAIENGCDFIGLVFAENSSRFVDPNDAKNLGKLVPKNIEKVAVTIDINIDKLQKIAENFQPQYFQLHDVKDIKHLEKIKKTFPEIKLILAWGVDKNINSKNIHDFENLADFYLFDNKISGSGNIFDWDLLNNLKINKPWFLSGGININNISEAIEKTKASYIDISSGIELTKGIKSPQLIIEIMEKFKSLKNKC